MVGLQMFLRRTEFVAPLASTQLDGPHSSSITTLTVDSTTNYPNSGILLLNREYVFYTGKTSTTFTGCTRGFLESLATTHVDNQITVSVRFQFLYLPGDDEDDSLDYGAPVTGLPGNDAEGITGRESLNFIIDLANYKAAEAISGWLYQVPQGDFPTLTPPSIHIIPLIHGGQSQQEPTFDATGRMFRNCLHEFSSDQGSGNFTDMSLGIPNWGAVAGGGFTYSGRSPEDVTISSIQYRIFQGRMKRLRTRFSAGYEDQFMYSFNFEVGLDI